MWQFDGEEENEENKGPEDDENLRLDNEIKKIKLSLEHGTDLSNQLSEADLPPQVEGRFLDYIQQFEEEFAKRKTILVYDLAGRPDFTPAGEIPDDLIGFELSRIMDILNRNAITITTLCITPDRTLYQFITEELFVTETNDIRIPGMTHAFIYEEFHPNHEYDIRNRLDELMRCLFDKSIPNPTDRWELADEVTIAGNTYTKARALEKIGHFRDAFHRFDLHDFQSPDVILNEACDVAEVSGGIHFCGYMETSEKMEFADGCSFSLQRDTDWWMITAFTIPGLHFEP